MRSDLDTALVGRGPQEVAEGDDSVQTPHTPGVPGRRPAVLRPKARSTPAEGPQYSGRRATAKLSKLSFAVHQGLIAWFNAVYMADTGTTLLMQRTSVQPGRPRDAFRATRLLAAVGVLSVVAVVLPGPDAGLPTEGRLTLVVFTAAVLGWVLGGLDDTFVGLVAVVALTVAGVLDPAQVFASLGGDIVWLLIGAFVMAAGLSATGLPARIAVGLAARARTVRQLAHLCTAVVVGSALVVPSTAGRAALAMPVFLALARGLAGRTRVVRALAVLFPTVILLSAVATLTGAGAHLITDQLVTAATGDGIGYGRWLLLGLPFAVVSSHVAAEVVLAVMCRRTDRRTALCLDRADVADAAGVTVDGAMSWPQRRALVITGLAVVGWCTSGLHSVPTALVALIAGLAMCAPRVGTVELSKALGTVPWPLLMFMATTMLLGTALNSSGAAGWLAGLLPANPGGSLVWFLAVVVGVSVAAHLVLQSRSARSAVLVPVLIPAAVAAGLNPAAIAFASTAAAGFCHTLPASAKPMAVFATVDDVPTFGKADLARLSVLLAPLLAVLVIAFALWVWPHLGLPLQH
ncbi:SLC13 family permease [Kribbella caucasensis]|uniref:SLC13 family permease n=1 Tax=Kribbella caucasensis TaxID=2512215 RepID=UPI00192DF44A|nr:SLC13 family permease [Kribbella sp. VKM Ac-2527]